MGLGYRSVDLQAIAKGKLADAILLIQHKRYSNAYYLLGYAVEIALKACIAGNVTAKTIPDKAVIKDFLNHDIKKLIGIAGLTPDLQARMKADTNFAAHWAVVCEWSTDSRYAEIEAMAAQWMLNAVADSKSGVITWIQTHW